MLEESGGLYDGNIYLVICTTNQYLQEIADTAKHNFTISLWRMMRLCACDRLYSTACRTSLTFNGVLSRFILLVNALSILLHNAQLCIKYKIRKKR